MDFQSDYHLLHENKLPTYFYMDFFLLLVFFSSASSSPVYWIAKCILSHFLDYTYPILFFSMVDSVQFTLYFAYSISVRWTILLHCSIIKCIHWKITIYLSIYILFLLLLLCSFYLRIFFLLDIPNKIDQ